MRFDQPEVATAQVLGIDQKLQFANITDTKARATFRVSNDSIRLDQLAMV
jgi:hypothetical protein